MSTIDESPIDQSTEQAKHASARRTRRSFLIGGLGVVGAYEFYRWIDRAPGDQLIPRPLREALNFNAKLSRGVFDERGLTPTYDVARSVDLRINGNYGLKQDLVMDAYRLQVVGVDQPKKYAQYVDDVTAWNYKYAAADAPYAGHDTKVNPKDEAKPAGASGPAKPAGNAGPAKDMSKASATGEKTQAKPVAKPDGGAQSLGPKPNPAEGPPPDMTPEFAAAFAKAMQDNSDGRPMRGQEEAGESDSTLDPGTPGLLLTMDDVTRLPRHELVTQFKCIEGWSEIVHWGGFRLADFIAAYPPARNAQGELPKYVYMETPNGDYYVGFDMAACMHPQSLLCTEMAGKPLAQMHGAPLRLHMPIKYGYKQIKRIALIAYTDEKPDDYWTKLGYDWYAGL